MKRKFLTVGLAAAVMAAGMGAMAGCGGGVTDITVAFSRPSTSGTYGAFNELVKNSEGKTIADALKEGDFSRNVQFSSENGTVISDVNANRHAIGYISLGLVEANRDKIKAVKVGGVEATVANIENGSYKLSRPFNLIYKTDAGLSDLAQNFLDFINSSAGQETVNADYIGTGVTVPAYTPYAGTQTKLVFSGSTSIQPLMNGEDKNGVHVKGLIEKFKDANPGKNFTVECSGSGSGQGEKDAAAEKCDFGMISREPGGEYTAEKGYTCVKIAIDGIAIVVQKDVALGNVTMDQLYDLYLNGKAIACE